MPLLLKQHIYVEIASWLHSIQIYLETGVIKNSIGQHENSQNS